MRIVIYWFVLFIISLTSEFDYIAKVLLDISVINWFGKVFNALIYIFVSIFRCLQLMRSCGSSASLSLLGFWWLSELWNELPVVWSCWWREVLPASGSQEADYALLTTVATSIKKTTEKWWKRFSDKFTAIQVGLSLALICPENFTIQIALLSVRLGKIILIIILFVIEYKYQFYTKIYW